MPTCVDKPCSARRSFAAAFPRNLQAETLLDIPFFLPRAGIAMDRDLNQAAANEKTPSFRLKNPQLRIDSTSLWH
jgi:hypothetical protein